MMRKQPKTWKRSVPQKLLVSITNDHRLRSCITGKCYVLFCIGGGEIDLCADHICSLSYYMDLYQARRPTLLKRRGGLVSDHPDPVVTTWLISIEKVEQVNPTAPE